MSNLLSDLNDNQKQAVQHQDGPCLVVAGAGTGKTTVITRRIAWLIQQGLARPEEIVALTFTDKAAREMEERVDQLVKYGQTGYTISTFHSFAAEILRDSAFLISLPSNFSLLTTAEEIVLARQLLFDFPLEIIKPGSDPNHFLRQFINFISHLKEEYVGPEEFTQFVEARRGMSKHDEEEQTKIWHEIAQCYRIYQNRLIEEGALGFADLIPQVLQLFEQHPLVETHWQKTIKYLLIDEYQDTNWVQAELASKLVAKSSNIFAVGDDDQAIYAFRGAAVGNILGFRRRYPQTKIIVLSENYRSSQNILDLAYRLIQNNNPNRLEFSEKINKRLTSTKVGPEPQHYLFTTGTAESTFIAEQIKERVSTKKFNYQDIVILIRSRHQAESLRTSLKAKSVPHVIVSDRRFYQLPVIKLVLSYLKLIADPTDSANFYFVLTSPLVGLAESDLKDQISKSHYYNSHLFQILDSWDNQRYQQLKNLIKEQMTLARDEPTSGLLLRVLHDSGLYQQLLNSSTTDSDKQIEQLGILYEVICSFEEKHRQAKVEDFISYLDSVIESGEDIAPPEIELAPENSVQIMTVHQSKGLEFPVVFIPGASKGLFPSRFRRNHFAFPEQLIKEKINLWAEENERDIHLAEERRLFYVACTRAAQELLVTSAIHYSDSNRQAALSPFVLEAFGDQAKLEPRTVDHQSVFQLELPLEPSTADYQPPTTIQQKAKSQGQISVSPSKIETYQTCPYRYRYAYFIKLKVLPAWQLNFGTSIHAALRLYYDKLRHTETAEYQSPTTDQQKVEADTPISLKAIIDQCWQSGGYENKTHERRKKAEAQQAIKLFISTERGRQIPERMEETFVFQTVSKDKITGRIDRIDRLANNRLIISDYKTSPKIDNYNPKDSLQLAVYALALEHKGEKVDQVGFIFPLTGQEQFVKTSGLDLKKRELEIAQIVEEIKKSEAEDNFPAKPTMISCQWCDYQKICPFRHSL